MDIYFPYFPYYRLETEDWVIMHRSSSYLPAADVVGYNEQQARAVAMLLNALEGDISSISVAHEDGQLCFITKVEVQPDNQLRIWIE